ncbi:condensin-2 complex subunit H2-like [Vanessa atalanta]|uniref:condensin-2 complex subunit H2-like n=1 Tax=Vanessa atalanta TaxID=42275 RepID=UPI001FCDC650|nr:condensin-2 complex subunit H2-like [Vanessa atalanta]
MATVFITFFLITQLYVCKMDADCRERRRNISQRRNRWSMNSQRLEEIVAELMRPISDVRRSFDTDLSALLEEYLTEAGLHALDAEEREVENATIPNFAELALLLQQSASIYSRKVDFLYQHVLNVSESLHNSTQEATASTSTDEPQTPSSGRRRRRASAAGEFVRVELEASAAARREAAVPRPPPTLPRMYVELEPRVLADCDVPLRDYAGEPIGLLGDFHVTWRLQDGLLVEELAGGGVSDSSLRALPLTELQAAIEAAAPPSPPPCFSPPSSPVPLPATSSPTPPSSSPVLLSAPATPPPEKRERKRRNDGNVEDMEGAVKLLMNKRLRRRFQCVEEFSIPEEWVSRVVRARKAAVLHARRALAEPPAAALDFRGFDISASVDVGGFVGWSTSEAVQAALAAEATAAARRPDDSDDDGFFEQSSLGDSDTSRNDDCGAPTATALAALPGTAEWSSWRERVVARAAATEARGVDVQRSAAALLVAAQALPPCSPFSTLLERTAEDAGDVSKLFLATLFLANAGNVQIVQGPALTLNTFSVRLVSTDERLYRTVAAADEQFLR